MNIRKSPAGSGTPGPALVKEMGSKKPASYLGVRLPHLPEAQLGRKKPWIIPAIVKAAWIWALSPVPFEDVTGPTSSFCVPSHRVDEAAEESGVDIKMRLCDTMGYGVPYPGAALPGVPKLVRA